MTLHEMYAGIPPVLAGYTNDQVLTAATRLQSAMLEVQRFKCGHYKRRPSRNSKPASKGGFVHLYYTRTYGEYTEDQAARVVALARAKGIRAAARETGVPRATVSDWVQWAKAEEASKAFALALGAEVAAGKEATGECKTGNPAGKQRRQRSPRAKATC